MCCFACLRQFLHPSQDDSFRLVSFLLERLSEKKQGIKTSPAADDIACRPKVENFRDISDHRMVKLKEEEDNDETFDMHIHKVEAVLKDLTMTPDISPSHAENASADGSTLTNQPSSGYEEHSSIDPSEVLLPVFLFFSTLCIWLYIYIRIVMLDDLTSIICIMYAL